MTYAAADQAPAMKTNQTPRMKNKNTIPGALRTAAGLLLLGCLLLLGGATARADEDGHDHSETDLSPFQPDLTPGYVLVEGDIQIPYDEYLRRTSGLLVAASTFGPATKWPDNVVPFDFVTTGQGAVSAFRQSLAIAAMTEISARSGIVFRSAVGTDPHRIRFQSTTNINSSPVGMQVLASFQIINIASWESQIIICHEIYHSLGFHHTQSRNDRDFYVTINEANICDLLTAFNFWTVPFTEPYGEYDFDSFMQYGRKAFNCGDEAGPDTITVKEPWTAEWQTRIGQRTHFSYYDTINVRARYPMVNDRWLDRNHFGFANGNFEEPWQHTSLAAALAPMPAGGTLFVKHGNSYQGVGTHSKPITIVAPVGDVTFGN